MAVRLESLPRISMFLLVQVLPCFTPLDQEIMNSLLFGKLIISTLKKKKILFPLFILKMRQEHFHQGLIETKYSKKMPINLWNL
jgi:hypothetical protein